MAEHLITKTGHLLDAQGSLREPGYALRPPFEYRRADIVAPAARIKDWDYYLVNDERYALALTFSDLGYIGLVSASIIDFDARDFTTTSEFVLMPMGRMGLPASSDTGDVSWSNRRCKVSFAHVGKAGEPGHARRLSFSMKRFDNRDELEAELLLFDDPRDSMVICTPWDEDPNAFYYNRKIVGMKARGGFRVGSLFHEFSAAEDAEDGPALGLLDWGRGVWTYENVWYWGVGHGYQNGHLVGINLGYGFGNTSAASENMVFVDGIAHKLGRLGFGIPKTTLGDFDYMSPWFINDDAGSIDLRFNPEIDRSDYTDIAGFITTDQHQVFGKLTGTVTLEDGSVLELSSLPAACERVHNRY